MDLLVLLLLERTRAAAKRAVGVCMRDLLRPEQQLSNNEISNRFRATLMLLAREDPEKSYARRVINMQMEGF